MMEGAPIKYRLFELLDEGDGWTDELVPRILDEYDMHYSYARDHVNFYLMEFVSGGFASEVDYKVDEDGHYKEGALLTKYSITPSGKAIFAKLQTTVNKRFR